MSPMVRLLLGLLTLLACSAQPGSAWADEGGSLDGLWASYKRFGPEISGPLLIDPERKHAEVSGHRVAVTELDGSVKFALPAERGEFVGRLQAGSIRGHWIQPAPVQIGQRMASPVTLHQTRSGWWRGVVRPKPSEYTFYLPITETEDGFAAYLRNPDRNLGLFTRIKRIEQRAEALSFIGSWGSSKEARELARGIHHLETDTFTLRLSPWRGGTYEFSRISDDTYSHFHPRPKNDGPWVYRAPAQLEDGWQTGTLDELNIDLAPIRQLLDQEIITADDSLHSHRIHGLLIARAGKLVLEEYFHGFSRDTHHDTRSASKSVVSLLVGAAKHAGYPIDADTPVYATLRGERSPGDPRKEAMTLKHLLTMSSGFYCDDNDPDAPGNEGRLQDQTDEPDWYRYTLDLPMAHDPGSEGIYCSANSNLIGALISQVTGQTLKALVAELIAGPLQIDHYYLGLQPTGEVYFGGGAQWRPRDFMKIGQLILNGGTWNGRRVIDADWIAESAQEQIKIGGRGYGYQWWISEYPYQNETVTAVFAAGNGGQIVMAIPELDLVVAFYGGSYSDGVFLRSQNELIPNYVLPAVQPLTEKVR